ncbi:hypothetical protein HC823_01100, partial [Candidatus Gracilibacteria bacterium]|nr:hypothetical protein [Candidatus Gracilibacteria bacterium]
MAVVLTSTFALLARTTSTNTNVKNRIIALNIAREGIEAVRSIRDTNWLKYSGDRRNKWLCLDSEVGLLSDIDCTDHGDKISEGLYAIDFSEAAGRYFLKQEVFNTDENNIISASTVKANSADFDVYRLYQDATTNKLTHIESGNQATPFYRQIELVPNKTQNCGSLECNDITEMSVIVRVFWLEEETGRTLRRLRRTRRRIRR